MEEQSPKCTICLRPIWDIFFFPPVRWIWGNGMMDLNVHILDLFSGTDKWKLSSELVFIYYLVIIKFIISAYKSSCVGVCMFPLIFLVSFPFLFQSAWDKWLQGGETHFSTYRRYMLRVYQPWRSLYGGPFKDMPPHGLSSFLWLHSPWAY